tara:strand:+ start:10962 stop:11882 length:921 start_codon:yes stop_codon:yes gene_type:complete
MNNNNENIVASFYKFARWNEFADYRGDLLDICLKNELVGTILIASEGINGSISGTQNGIDNVLKYIRTIDQFTDLNVKYSLAYGKTFRKMKVRLKKEIVSMGKDNVAPDMLTGQLLNPNEWDNLLDQDDVLVIDTRNTYEHSIGSFKGATYPNTSSFREFPDWVDNFIDHNKDKKIAMYCTGGIRCEKASSYLLSKGYKNVYQLDGGILKYLEERPEDDSKWNGECFVFDYRVSLEHKLNKGNHEMCHACRMPLSETDLKSEFYKKDMSCPYCHDKQNEKSMKRFKERKLQLELEKQRNVIEQRDG